MDFSVIFCRFSRCPAREISGRPVSVGLLFENAPEVRLPPCFTAFGDFLTTFACSDASFSPFYSFKTNFCWLFRISTTAFALESWLRAVVSWFFQIFGALFSRLRGSDLPSGDFLKIRVLAFTLKCWLLLVFCWLKAGFTSVKPAKSQQKASKSQHLRVKASARIFRKPPEGNSETRSREKSARKFWKNQLKTARSQVSGAKAASEIFKSRQKFVLKE